MIDVVFDHYKGHSIKNTTRQKRGFQKSIDIEIDRPNFPLPQQYNLFIHSIFNKRRLTNFLPEQLLQNSIQQKHILFLTKFLTSGGFAKINKYGKNFEPSKDHFLNSNDEDADIRILLHILSAKNSGHSRCIIY
ncbi:unnamed protein product [Psylliodes chrysocephalus]|uniref:Uncharacterized protein n=1 Tax=Psylliodes chrysocephalus TaxID=3402493 RepID=A0A9P0G6M9_9CUCU|nr:unnamed protein product [Psylliodes chrysocephala]